MWASNRYYHRRLWDMVMIATAAMWPCLASDGSRSTTPAAVALLLLVTYFWFALQLATLVGEHRHDTGPQRSIDSICRSLRVLAQYSAPDDVPRFAPLWSAFVRGGTIRGARSAVRRHTRMLGRDTAILAGRDATDSQQEEWSRLTRVLRWAADDVFDEERVRVAFQCSETYLRRLYRGDATKPIEIGVQIEGEPVIPSGDGAWDRTDLRNFVIAVLSGLVVLAADKTFGLLHL